jgi:hypothetical protein
MVSVTASIFLQDPKKEFTSRIDAPIEVKKAVDVVQES